MLFKILIVYIIYLNKFLSIFKMPIVMFFRRLLYFKTPKNFEILLIRLLFSSWLSIKHQQTKRRLHVHRFNFQKNGLSLLQLKPQRVLSVTTLNLKSSECLIGAYHLTKWTHHSFIQYLIFHFSCLKYIIYKLFVLYRWLVYFHFFQKSSQLLYILIFCEIWEFTFIFFLLFNKIWIFFNLKIKYSRSIFQILIIFLILNVNEIRGLI